MKKFYCNYLSIRHLFLMITLPLVATSFAQTTTVGEPEIGKTKAAKFSPDAFLIGRDFHHNKFIDHKKGLKGMAECHFTVADAADPQEYSLCEKLGLSVVVSVGPHLTGGDWLKLS